MDQSAQPDAVYGVEVERALFGDIMPIQVDVSESAHSDRVRSLGDLSGQSAYHLITNYD